MPSRRKVPGWLIGVFSSVLAAMVAAAAAVLIPQLEDKTRDTLGTAPTTQSLAAPQNGNALGIEVLGVSSTASGGSTAFPVSLMTVANKFAAAQGVPSFTDMLAAGGYATHALNVGVSLTGQRNAKVTVYNVEVTNLRREDIPAGALILVPAEGGELVEHAVFPMDVATPVAHAQPSPNSINSYGPQLFFDTTFIELGNGDTEVLRLQFLATTWAYSFDITVDYEIDGKRLTQRIPEVNGQPYRVAGLACSNGTALSAIPSADRSRFVGLHYQVVSKPADDYLVRQEVDPVAYC